MKRIEINVTTGVRKEIELTAEEVADAQSRTAAIQRERAREAAETELKAKRAVAIDALLSEAMQNPSAPAAVKEYAALLGK